MNNQDRRAGFWLMLLSLGLACMLLVVGGLMRPLQTASADLPPRPTPITPTSTPSPKSQEHAGAWIELRVHQTDSNLPIACQQFWTAVQWQDAQGRWHDVEGWRGTLDAAGNGVGRKVWWVAQPDFGKGPFRWVVYRGQGSEYLGESDPFDLPETAGMTLEVEASLAP